MAINVNTAELNLLAGTTVSDQQFVAMLGVVARLVRAEGYKTTIEDAEGYAEAILNNIYLSVLVRLATNPTSLRSVGLGSASLGFAGNDAELTQPFSLSTSEKAQLNRLMPTKSAYVLKLKPFTPYVDYVEYEDD